MTTQQLTIRDVHIDAPGQHPGGGEWWITPRPEVPVVVPTPIVGSEDAP